MWRSKNILCDIISHSCPYKIFNSDKGLHYCDFVNVYAELNIKGEREKIDRSLKKVCPEIREEILHHNYRAGRLKEQEKQFLAHVQPGDVCFCTAAIENVIFIEYPSNVHGDVKYQTADGKIFESPSFCFRIISKGNVLAKYETPDKEKAESYSRLARRNGFRVEIDKIKDTFLLKIYGDLQEEIDEFVTNLENDFVIDDFYNI